MYVIIIGSSVSVVYRFVVDMFQVQIVIDHGSTPDTNFLIGKHLVMGTVAASVCGKLLILN